MSKTLIELTVLALAVAAHAQSATPTPDKQAGLIAWQVSCDAPPCDLDEMIPARGRNDVNQGGYLKTVTLSTTGVSAPTDVMCKVADSALAPEIVAAQLTGAACPTPGNCSATISQWCDNLWLRVNGCTPLPTPTGTPAPQVPCSVSAWLRQEAR